MKDYFLVCESYYEAVRTAPPTRIQAIDVNRRSLHDEGSMVLRDRLLNKIVVDADTRGACSRCYAHCTGKADRFSCAGPSDTRLPAGRRL